MRGIRYVIFWTTMAVLAGQYAVAGASKPDLGVPEHTGPGTPGIEQVGDIQFVANIGDTIGWSGSDIEFASREVVKLSEGATGDPVCVVDANDPEGCARDAEGNKVFQTEVRDFAIAGGYGQAARIIDITTPAAPVHVNNTPCSISQNDIQINGDLLLVAADGGGSCKRPDGSNATFAGTAVLDFSDPRNPTYLSRLQYGRGSHNHTFHPGGRYVYLSDSDLASAGLGNVPIWDLADPANPVLVTEFKHLVHSPHDITFSADGKRAYAAAVTATYILNTEDPRAPTVISTIANEGISISHQSDPTPDGDFLLVSDELGGGAAGPVSSGGPVHVYDLTNEAAPVKVGIIGNDCVVLSCEDNAPVHVSTSHVFRINPDGYTAAIAWYNDGVHVLDYSGIRGAGQWGAGTATKVGAQTIGRMKMPGANTWAAKMWMERHPGYVFANDINRGFDVFYVPSMGPGYLARGTIQGGHPGSFSAGVGITKTEWETQCEYSPASNGVDGWLAPVPANVADGAHTITARAINDRTGGLYDLDMYFYDANCGLLAADEDEGTNETGDLPEGTKYVLTTAFVGGNITVGLTTSPA